MRTSQKHAFNIVLEEALHAGSYVDGSESEIVETGSPFTVLPNSSLLQTSGGIFRTGCGGGGNAYVTPAVAVAVQTSRGAANVPSPLVPSPRPSPPRAPPQRPRAPPCAANAYLCDGRWIPAKEAHLLTVSCICGNLVQRPGRFGWGALLELPKKIIHVKLSENLNDAETDMALEQIAHVAQMEAEQTLMLMDKQLQDAVESKRNAGDPWHARFSEASGVDLSLSTSSCAGVNGEVKN